MPPHSPNTTPKSVRPLTTLQLRFLVSAIRACARLHHRSSSLVCLCWCVSVCFALAGPRGFFSLVPRGNSHPHALVFECMCVCNVDFHWSSGSGSRRVPRPLLHPFSCTKLFSPHHLLHLPSNRVSSSFALLCCCLFLFLLFGFAFFRFPFVLLAFFLLFILYWLVGTCLPSVLFLFA